MLRHLLASLLFSTFMAQHLWAAENGSSTPRIVATIQPLGLLAAEVIGADAKVDILIPPGTSPHHYQLKPSQIKALNEADIILWVGRSLEPYMEKTLSNIASGKTVITIDTLATLKKLNYRSSALWSHDDHGHASSLDGHVWLSPTNAIVIATRINETLATLHPDNKHIYDDNLAKLSKRITETDLRIASRLNNYRQTPFFVYHDAFQYFETHYNLNALGAFTTESAHTLSAKRLMQLTNTALAQHVKCIFADQQYSSDVPEKVAQRTGAHVVTLDHFGVGITIANGGYPRLLETIGENMLSCFEQAVGH